MKKIIQILIGVVLIAFIAIGGLWALFKSGYGYGVHESPDFDLFIAEVIFKDFESVSLSENGASGENEIWNRIPSSVWQSNDSIAKLPVEWIFDVGQFEKSDSVSYGIRNVSGSKFYYMSWGAPNSRIRTDYFIYKNDEIDTLLFNGHGCGTEIFLAALEDKMEAIGTEPNPLLRNPYPIYELDLKCDSFPINFKSVYGDSIGIRFRLPSYSLPWSKYESQMITSEVFMVSTNRLIDFWEKEYKRTITTPN